MLDPETVAYRKAVCAFLEHYWAADYGTLPNVNLNASVAVLEELHADHGCDETGWAENTILVGVDDA